MADKDVDNFDDLINEVAEKPAKPPTRSTTRKAPAAPQKASKEDPVESAEDARIRALEEQLATPMPIVEPEPREDPEKEVKKARIKDLEDKLARRNTAIIDAAPTTYEADSENGEKILLHIREDGFIALGEVWYRGQELEFTRGSVSYERTKDSLGNTWIDLAGDENAQLSKWGHYYLGSGPFVPRKGERFDDDLVAEDARRGRAIPTRRF